MTQDYQAINDHVKAYLDYYCSLSYAPGFAILLKGKWGAGKTWFIDRYCQRLEDRNHKFLYISLYGISTLSEIEDKFFQLLHPIRSSKAAAITGIIAKGLLKGALKIDLNQDRKEEGTWNIQIPEITFPKHLDDVNNSILIFDDLERCSIEISSLLGYINYFVEHQDLKVILIANEDELINKYSSNYQTIKEKLIGKTFGIFPDFEGALESFITQINNTEVIKFLSNSTEIIKDLYSGAEYENLRNLKQIVLDFARIFDSLPEKAKNKPEILMDLLKLLMAFSIEIKRGLMLPQEISKLQGEYTTLLSKRINSRQIHISTTEDKNDNQNLLQKIINRYPSVALHEPFPNAGWWQDFFDRGIIDEHKLEQSILTSRYFQDENTPDWIRLWHFSDLSDNDFDNLIKKIETSYNRREFQDIGIVKHIFGLFLKFSDAEIYAKSKSEILRESKKYIDDLKNTNRLEPLPYIVSLHEAVEHMYGSYLNLGFQGKEFSEFNEFSTYISEVQHSVGVEKMPDNAQDLLNTMSNDILKFQRMISPSSSSIRDIVEPRYHKIPILKHISPITFVNKILTMKHEDRQYIFWAIGERYEYYYSDLIEELDWLRTVQTILLEEAERRKGKLSGFCLRLLNTFHVKEIIEKFEIKSEKLQTKQ